ncbi:MAG: dehydrogenase [Candidatus Marinimicrobia bacterium]|nr:dehydrogenase [Candidatus Neomarinimicrobiota bacterium]
MLNLLRQGKISKWFSGIGQEAISVGATNALKPNDTIFTMHRNLGVFTSRKIPLQNLIGQIIGTEEGFTQGRDRSFHFGVPEYNIIGMISHLAAMLPVANGVALGYKLKKQKRVALAFVGDGATSEGDFHEALNLAAVWQLPVIFLIENNGYGLSTPTSEQYLCKNLSDRAVGYGMKGMTIDGNNIESVYTTIKKIAEDMRKNPSPVLIEAKTFRIRGHEEASGVKYVPKELIEKWKRKDPIKNFESTLADENIFNEEGFDVIRKSIKNKIEQDIESALKTRLPSSSKSKELSDVYADYDFQQIEPSESKKEIRYVDAIQESLHQSMKKDEKIIIMGQDIAEYGGVFKITEGFVKEFGKSRIRNTPIIESGIIGACLGLSLEGFKPIVEMQFADFISCGFNQVINNLAKTHYRWSHPVSVTLRMPTGGGVNAGPFHSQNLESIFMHIPGLKIIYPSSPYDAKGLLSSAINEPNPVLFFEHKFLYRTQKEMVPKNLYNIEIGKGRLVQTGKDITIIAYGLSVIWINEIIQEVKNEISIELIDLRTLLPWDKDIVYESIKKTNKGMIVHEANQTGGVGAEIAASVNKDMFEYLDAPFQRFGSIDIPTPFNQKLEQNVFWPKSTLLDQIKELVSY